VKDAEGKGIMSRAAARLVRYAFDDLELEKLVLYIKPDNIRSQKLAERLGAVKTEKQAMDPTLHDVWEISKGGE
jgi:RimJ/RimL family protein N-acetyltransferase